MRHIFRRYLPHHDSVRQNRWLRPFATTLLHPRLWHLNRHSAAGAVAVGLFCGLIPGPFQMLGAALCCVVLRVNLPLALLTTLYTNPFTIVPLYVLAFGIGQWLTGGQARFTPPPDWAGETLASWLLALQDWFFALGQPLVLGLLVLAISLATVGYFSVRAAWRLHLVRAWRRRGGHRRATPPPGQD